MTYVFFLLGVQHIFWLQKAKKQHLWNLGNSFFFVGVVSLLVSWHFKT